MSHPTTPRAAEAPHAAQPDGDPTPSPPPGAAGWELTLDTAVRVACHLHAGRVALTWRDRSLTYAQLDAASSALAAAHRAAGIAPGDRILCRLPNRPELLLSAAAAWRCGAIHTATDRDLTAPELAALAAHLEPRAVLLESHDDPHTAATIDALGRASPATRVLTCEDIAWPAGPPAAPPAFGSGPASPPAAPEPTGSPHSAPEDHPNASPLDPAVILTTSGTTGAPRHVLREHGELTWRWWASAKRMEASPGEAHLVQLPLSHGFGFGLAMGALLTGGRLVLMERFSAEEAVRLIEHERIGVLNGAPPHYELILSRLEDPNLPHADISSLRAGCGSGAIFPAPLVRRILDTLRLSFTLTYGSSEGLGWGTRDPDDLRLGSVGRPPAEHLRIVDPSDRHPLPAGAVGEIAIRRQRPLRLWEPGMPSGRRGAPPAAEDGDTGPDAAGGWHHTGDLGRLDPDGRLHVLGRLGTQICRGGVWVQPEEVEAALAGHPLLRDVAVLGVPDPLLGERVCACIVPATTRPTLADLSSWLAERLARFKHPELLCLLDKIPRGPVGKVDRNALRERVSAAQGRSNAPAAP